nr:DUF1501 domain-containing protein [Saprospiraceae bacterium]
MKDRRAFLKNTAFASASMMAPGFVVRSGLNADAGQKILVVVQLSGGNDGLNTIIPYRDDLYYKFRPKLSIGQNLILPITADLGFHPALAPLRAHFDQGEMLLINGVGYPNPNRSHFRSMDIWQTGSDADSYLSTGWLGRYLDHDCEGCSKAYHALQIGDNLGLALQGSQRDGFAMRDGHHLRRMNSNSFLQKLGRHTHRNTVAHHEELGYLYKTMIEVQESADYLIQQSKVVRSKSAFPTHPFGRGMKLISELITAGTTSKVYYISLPGFDTHANQLARQNKLLRIYAEAMSSLVQDLKRHRLFDDCLI